MASINLDQQISINSNEFDSIADNIQGNILKSHGRNFAAQLFIQFSDKDKALRCIRRHILNRITSAGSQRQDSLDLKNGRGNNRRTFISFSLSKAGYDFFEIDDSKTPSDQRFRLGMRDAAVKQKLIDPAVNKWQKEFRTEWHAVLIIANTHERSLKRTLRPLRRKIDRVSTKTYTELGEGITNNAGAHIEHFGYVDGISQPLLLNDNVVDGQVLTNNWDPLSDLSLALVNDPGIDQDNCFGSYLVFRKLEQNVKKFKTAEINLATQLNTSVAHAGAQMVGRYKSGLPLVEASPPLNGRSASINDFNYDADNSVGSKCPFHGHIRRTNPRGSGGREELDDEKTHLFVRRGITYGGDSRKEDKLPSKGFGLLFMAYNSNISKQFEFMQAVWANQASNFPFHRAGPGKRIEPHGIDPIIGQSPNNDLSGGQNYFETWGDDNSIIRSDPSMGNFVTMKGGEYFFTPSIPFLRSI